MKPSRECLGDEKVPGIAVTDDIVKPFDDVVIGDTTVPGGSMLEIR